MGLYFSFQHFHVILPFVHAQVTTVASLRAEGYHPVSTMELNNSATNSAKYLGANLINLTGKASKDEFPLTFDKAPSASSTLQGSKYMLCGLDKK